MKSARILALFFTIITVVVSPAQTASDYVTQGRAFLSVSNLVGANSSFSNAVVLSPNDETANVFYGVTRLLVWPNQPAGSNFLTRLGVSTTGRNPYHWTALPATDTNGVPLAPAGVNASEITAVVHTNLLPLLASAEANLATVTDTNFTLSLTSSETLTTPVTLDYGDVKLLRAFTRAAEFECYTLYEWNVDAPLSEVRSIYQGQVTFEQFLLNHPQLFTFATTNDLQAAKAAFLAGVNLYFEASQWIRNRPTNVVRLFNADPATTKSEASFRASLSDLTNSLVQTVTPTVATNYMVHFGSLFEGKTTLRSLLPTIHDNSFALGTMPDPTFGGLVYGVSSETIDSLLTRGLSRALLPIPTISPVFTSAGPQVTFELNVAKGRGYVMQVSTNLNDWQDYTASFALGARLSFVDPLTYSVPRRFYRLVDRTQHMPAPPNDSFANRIPLSGLGIVAEGYDASASIEPGEPGWLTSTVWWSWTAPSSGTFVISTQGSTPGTIALIYTGSSLDTLVNVASGSQPFYAVAGTTYQIQVGGWYVAGGIKLTIASAPNINVTAPADGAVFTAPTDIPIQVTATDADATIKSLSVYENGTLLASTTGASLNFIWTNVHSGYYYFQVQAVDSLGISSSTSFTAAVRPANDAFANRTPISSTPAVVAGSNAGATKEPGEPLHAGQPGGASVWWTWTSPFNGVVTISTLFTSPSYYPWGSALAVYTGNSISNLISIASNVPTYYGQPAQVSFSVTAGVVCQIAVDSDPQDTGDIMLSVVPTQAPLVNLLSPTNGAVLLGPTNVTLKASATDTGGSIAKVEFLNVASYMPQSIGISTNPPFNVVWSNLSGGSYSVAVKATDNSGVSTWSPTTSFSIVPFNDSFSNRITLAGAPVTATGSNVGATKEPGEPDHAGNPGGASIWWTWTAPFTGPITITADLVAQWGPLPPLLGVYTGTSVSKLTTVVSNTPAIGNRAEVSFNAILGTSYQIAVDGLYGNTGGVTLQILPILPPSVSIVYPANGVTFEPLISTNLTVIAVANDSYGSIAQVSISSDGGGSWMASGSASPFLMAWSNISFGTYTLVARATDNYGVFGDSIPVIMNVIPAEPPNDNFTNRLTLILDSAVTDNNMAATSELGEPVYSGYTAGKSVWWNWTAPYTGFFVLKVSSAQMYSPILAVYTGTDLGSLREVGTSVGYNAAATLSFGAQAGSTYAIAVDDAYGYGGVFQLLLSPQ